MLGSAFAHGVSSQVKSSQASGLRTRTASEIVYIYDTSFKIEVSRGLTFSDR